MLQRIYRDSPEFAAMFNGHEPKTGEFCEVGQVYSTDFADSILVQDEVRTTTREETNGSPSQFRDTMRFYRD